jgi:hypothetical protein
MNSKEKRTANSVLPQLAETGQIEAECSLETFVLVDSEALRKLRLRVAAKPCLI